MVEFTSGRHALARITAPLVDGVKRVAAGIGVFTDTKAYKDEIAHYESGLGSTAGYESQPARTNGAEESEAAAS